MGSRGTYYWWSGSVGTGEAEVGSEQIPKFKIGSIHWSSAKVVRHKAESDTPHFSSDMRRRGKYGRNSEKFFKPKLN